MGVKGVKGYGRAVMPVKRGSMRMALFRKRGQCEDSHAVQMNTRHDTIRYVRGCVCVKSKGWHGNGAVLQEETGGDGM